MCRAEDTTSHPILPAAPTNSSFQHEENTSRPWLRIGINKQAPISVALATRDTNKTGERMVSHLI